MEKKKNLINAQKSTPVSGPKYELLFDENPVDPAEQPKDVDDSKLYRIRALKDFGEVKAGDLGGYIASYDVLSQEGNCWIGRNCFAFKHVRIRDNAQIKGNVELRGNTTVDHNAVVNGRVVAGDCGFEYNSRVEGRLILLHCATRGHSSITGEGCAEYLAIEFGKSVELNGYYPKGAIMS